MSSRLVRPSCRAVMRGLIARIALVLALGCAGIASSALWASTASASVPRRAQLRTEAIAIMRQTYAQFMVMKKYDRYGPFDWSSDGCSWTPNWKGFNLAAIFDAACEEHDFGYRNFGKGLRLGRNERRRAWIDNRFHTEMDRICNDKWGAWWQWFNRKACLGEAKVMYEVVHKVNYWGP